MSPYKDHGPLPRLRVQRERERMNVHHLNCGTMCPLLGRFVEGEGSIFSRGNRVCHCLLVETNAGLVLVETGIGMQDVLEPWRRFGWLLRGLTLPRFEPA